MADTTVDHLTRQAADRLHAAHGTSGRPKFIGLTAANGELYAAWDDGSIARAQWGSEGIYGWRAIPSPSYDALFCTTERVETMPGRDD